MLVASRRSINVVVGYLVLLVVAVAGVEEIRLAGGVCRLAARAALVQLKRQHVLLLLQAQSARVGAVRSRHRLLLVLVQLSLLC